ncbi:5-oxoprolinase subunit PxpB [Halieaceae bacterium IMCC14734]|uniref:5-oxoprolinase subunit PxpB n=1 Tax=Candidatus Litorirhabdus singularis TaxID=2518993 RepID=A0ABT3TFP1_9GAMM|nr:5-oxoprolinase subunit PxpB [Candidatus Litorirhabdus singularis]
MEIHSAGENAVMVYLGEGQSPEVSARVQQACKDIEVALGADLIDLVPSYASVLVIYQPLTTDHLSVHSRVRLALIATQSTAPDSGRLVHLPVWYDHESGPDLQSLAETAGLTPEQVIDIHQATEYRVYAIGFAPGFAYLGEVDPRIATPRKTTPRQKVPAGAVAIADAQTAVYPAPSPGGWNLIGLCPQPMFDPNNEPNMPVSVGDRVRFEAVSRQRYLELGGQL